MRAYKKNIAGVQTVGYMVKLGQTSKNNESVDL